MADGADRRRECGKAVMTKIWLWVAENGNVRKWQREPFAEGIETTANPGSRLAVTIGCTCPLLDNGHGDDEIGRIRGFYISEDCPVHAPPPKATP